MVVLADLPQLPESSAVTAALRKLGKIREDHFVWFTSPCYTLNVLLIWLARKAHAPATVEEVRRRP